MRRGRFKSRDALKRIAITGYQLEIKLFGSMVYFEAITYAAAATLKLDVE